MLDLLPRVILVRAEWDADAADWTAQSADIPGLVAEADTLELLQAKTPRHGRGPDRTQRHALRSA